MPHPFDLKVYPLAGRSEPECDWRNALLESGHTLDKWTLLGYNRNTRITPPSYEDKVRYQTENQRSSKKEHQAMSTPTDPRREHPSTYFVQDRSNEEEIARLSIQDHLTTVAMGGVLPEQPDPTSLRRVLDVACGTGDWLIQVAKTYPAISRLVGVDVNSRLIEYARKRAEAEQVSDRVDFRAMDALRMLEFPSASFDLVNQRFAWSFLRTWDWPKILTEYRRVCKPGGVIRVTESDIIVGNEEIAPALAQLLRLVLQAFFQAGHFFLPEENGVTSQLARLLQQYGLAGVQTHPYAIAYPMDSAEGQLMAENTRHLLRTVVPFLRKWSKVPDDYEALYQQAVGELQQNDRQPAWTLLTAWGTNPERRWKAASE
jgi:ubiquinone/menaquinone biosynthesis C-methylase UbiE